MDISEHLALPDSIRDSSAPYTAWQGHMAEDGGSTFGPIPCANLIATSDELWLKGTRGSFRIPRKNVVRIGNGKLYPWFFCAVGIYHNLTNCSRELQFKPTGTTRRAVFEHLRQLGYPLR